MTTLGEAAEWHRTRATILRMKVVSLAKMGVPKSPALEDDIKLHERFAVACREADGDESNRGAESK